MGLCEKFTDGVCVGFYPAMCAGRCNGEFGTPECAETLFRLRAAAVRERDEARIESERATYQKEKLQEQMLDSGEALQNVINARDNEIKALNARLSHLLESDYIKQFDMVDPKTREYAKPIREADEIVQALQETVDGLYKKVDDLIRARTEPAPPEHPKVFYVCDRRACEKCDPDCKYTSDITHAVNFELDNADMLEKIRRTRKGDWEI